MDYDILPPTDDWIFKLLFGDERNKSLLIDLLKSFVGLPEEEYELTFLDTHLKPESEGDKLGIIDIKVRTKTGKIMDIEIQVNPTGNLGKRISFYKSKLIVGQVAEGEDYIVIQRVICICITDFIIFPEEKDYLNNFRFANQKNGLCFEAIPEEVYTLELPKVPAMNDGALGWEWMRFLRAKRKEEFEMVAVQNPEIRKAVDKLYELSADEKVRAEYEMRLKARRDHSWMINSAREDGMEAGMAKGRQEGKAETARNLKLLGVSTDLIIKSTGLSQEEIAKL
jgi:predicted transposase/invertase (TIGR01784 family)